VYFFNYIKEVSELFKNITFHPHPRKEGAVEIKTPFLGKESGAFYFRGKMQKGGVVLNYWVK